eukprot:6198830-Pleurochrysis_carterae.AAC.3
MYVLIRELSAPRAPACVQRRNGGGITTQWRPEFRGGLTSDGILKQIYNAFKNISESCYMTGSGRATVLSF